MLDLGRMIGKRSVFVNIPRASSFFIKIRFLAVCPTWLSARQAIACTLNKRGLLAPAYMSRIVGIDLGTTNSLVAGVDSGIPFVVPDAEGRRLTPSVVNYPGPGQAPIVGDKANRVRVLRPEETAYSVKRFIGRRGRDIESE